MAEAARGKTYSMSMNVAGFIRNNRFPRGYDIFQRDDGTPMAPQKARAFLHGELAKGRKVIPCSSECGNPCQHGDNGCTGFDYAGGGCPGRWSKPRAEGGAE